MIRSLRSLKNLKAKRVLVRVDFNVPVSNGRVKDDARLRASLPTIQHLVRAKAKVILVTHLGRPEGKHVRAYELEPVAKRLSKLLDQPVRQLSGYSGQTVARAIEASYPGDVLMLQNIRFSPLEQGNKGALAKELAELADLFVLDGFAVAHRADASVSGIPAFLPSYAGLLLEQEIKGLTKLMKTPKHPFVALVGGAKMETKIPVLDALMKKADVLLVGGGIVNTMFAAMGYGVGDSIVDASLLKEALRYAKHRKVIVPRDVVIGRRHSAKARVVAVGKTPQQLCKKGEAIFDIGPETIRLFASHVKRAKMIVWNGAMGYFEQKPFDTGTLSVARMVASRSKGAAFGVIGGGETVQAMELSGMGEWVDLVSTGGGAMLEFLAGETLPGIAALQKKRR
jgi:phosphoglycerate kinase